MEILFVSSETAPFARAGGLADFSHDLPKALSELGHTVSIVTPKYRESDAYKDLINTGKTISVPIAWKSEEAEIFVSDISGKVRVYLVGKDAFYGRDGVYGNAYGDYEDNAERFIFFSRSVMELCLALNLSPDVIHCNEWQTGLVPVYLRTLYGGFNSLSRAATVFTIHNLGSQGIFWVYDYSLTGLGWEYFTPETLEFYGNLNLLKGGILFSELISTVSPTYAQEILSSTHGFGLEGVLTKRKEDIFPVLNGVDYEKWNPETDKHISNNYGLNNLKPKEQCKADLQGLFHLENRRDVPMVAIISGLVDRKGMDLISAVFEDLLALNLQFVIMGSGEDKYQSFFKDMKAKHPRTVGLTMAYDYPMAHRILAGADIFLMPSRYEPCGTEQLYGLKYGAIPVVRATGGLEDTVEDYDLETGEGTGFKFKEYTPQAMLTTMRQAVQVFQMEYEWKRLVRSAMKREFSWNRAAEEYTRLYELAVAKRKGS
jgi:starch synthase